MIKLSANIYDRLQKMTNCLQLSHLAAILDFSIPGFLQDWPVGMSRPS